MSSLTKGVGISRVSAKSIVVTVAVLLVVLALFFIPEIISFQRSLGSASHSETSGAALASRESKGALDQVSNLISGGYIEQLKAKKVAATTVNPSDKPATAGPTRVTWDDIKNKESTGALRAAQREALAMVKKLPSSKVASRYALLNLSSAIDMVLGGSDTAMSAEEALRYLEFVRSAAAGALQRDGAESADYNRMVEFPLGPAVAKLGQVGTARALQPFDPRLTFNGVLVKQQSDNYGRWNPRGKVYVYLRGFVIGKDVKYIEVYRDGQRYARITPRAPNGAGRRNFRTRQWSGQGLFSFQVVDKSGQTFEKQYRFYPRAAKFPWRRGSFQIPIRGENDFRVDRYFTARRGKVLGAGGQAMGSAGPGFARF